MLSQNPNIGTNNWGPGHESFTATLGFIGEVAGSARCADLARHVTRLSDDPRLRGVTFCRLPVDESGSPGVVKFQHAGKFARTSN